MILVIGQERVWGSLGRALPRDATLRFVAFPDLTCEFLQDVRPDLVICRLIDVGFDAAEVGQRLAAAGFEGRFRAVCHPLPNPSSIKAEITRVAGGIDFDLVMVAGRLS